MEKWCVFRMACFSYNYYSACWTVSTIFAFKFRKNVFLSGYNENICQSVDGRNKSFLTNFMGIVNVAGILNVIQGLKMLLHNIDTI